MDGFDLTGKTALVTGAGQGIGRQTALLLARHGARVWATGRRREPLEDLEGEQNVAVAVMDVTCAEQIQAVVDKAGPVDILVNCAGVVPYGDIVSCTDDDFRHALQVNVWGPYWTMKALVPDMARRGGGAVVNIASVYSSVTAGAGRFAYGTSKAAVVGMTKSVAADFAERKVRCNAVCPGAVDTPGLRQRIGAQPDPQAVWKKMVGLHRVGRIGTEQEIAYACLYLAADISAFLTGQVLVIDGGMTL